MDIGTSMIPRWQYHYASYIKEEDWDIKALRVVNRQLEDYIQRMPGGSGDLTLTELQEMATRQQQQMEAQQQVLVAKEQRLKYLRQQEARHTQLASEGERVRKMRERVESQELKLKKLRALRGQAEQYRTSNGSLNGELDAVKAVFNEKEKELAMAVARVDRLNRQLQELRSGNSNSGGQLDNKQAAVAVELEKLRKELLIRNKLNEQQSNTISAKEKMLNQRREEVTRMDTRIRELQQRLKKRQAQEAQMRQQQQQQEPGKAPAQPANRRQDSGRPLNSAGARNVATVEPYIQYAPQNVVKDDLYSKGGNFYKQDPKYQTLPARVKFVPSSPESGMEAGGKGSKLLEMNNNSELIEEYQLPTVVSTGVSSDQQEGNNSSQGYNTASNHHQNILDHNQKPGQSVRHNASGPFLQQPGLTNKPTTGNHGGQRVHDPGLIGAGDGVEAYPAHPKTSGPGPLNPVINIQEEERQAGSGQSSPASSEASNSSGGVQIKGENEINTAPIGPVSAMIERLNRTGQDRSVFTQRGGQLDGRQAGKTPGTAPASSGEPSESSYGRSQTRTGHEPGQPPPPVASSTPGYEETDFTGQGGMFQYKGPGQPTSSVPPAGTTTNSSGPHLNQKPAPTYRYASKSQIANTYMGRLSGAGMDKYQRNLSQIYRSLDSSTDQAGGDQAGAGVGEARTSFSQVSGQDGPEMAAGDSAGHHPQFGAVSSPGYPDIASDKGSFKLNTPKQVRRRHSDSENEDLNKALQERQELEQQERHKKTQQKNADKIAATADITASDQSKPESTASSDSKSAASSREGGKENQVKQAQADKKSKDPSGSDKPSSEANGSSVVAKKPESSDSSETKSAVGGGQPKGDGVVVRRTKSNLKKEGVRRSTNRVSFDPLALLLDASLEGELDLVKKVAVQVDDVSTPNDEGITALHNAICAGHYEIVKVLVEFGCDVNSPDSDGWTPLHCAASCNNLPMVRFLVEHGACVFATTISDQETAADKCEEEEDGYDGCSDYLYSIQEKLGITNSGEVYGVFDYQATKTDELSFQIGDKLTVLRKGDDSEKEWWWARFSGKEGYIPRNLLGLYPRVIPGPKEVSEC